MTGVIDHLVATIEDITKDPTLFLNVNKKAAESLRKSTKLLYDFIKKNSSTKTNSLPELVIDGFDEEQIWQQIDLQNEQAIPLFISDISKLLLNKELKHPSEESEDEEFVRKPSKKFKEFEDEDDEEQGEESAQESNNESGSEGEASFSETESTDFSKSKNKPRKRKLESSIVDDKFFKMQELNEYLLKEDKNEIRGQSKNEDQSDDESIDLFNGYSDTDSENEETQNEKVAKYADFFDSPESNEEEENRHDNLDQGGNLPEGMECEGEAFEHSEDDWRPSTENRVRFNLPVDSDDSNESYGESKEENRQEVMSTLEKRRARLNKEIEKQEAEAVSEKPWQLKGEVSASNRPQDSLLEDFVEVDVVSRPPPVITEETTLKLEDIIRQRIKDKAWDDVEKKVKPVNTPVEFKKKLIMDQGKSKLSLAEIYEKDFVKQREALNPVEKTEDADPPEHIEIKKSMHSLFRTLDALSNFHYTPKPSQPELKIISNIPAINMEEVAPVATSDATLLAPEEVQPKQRGELLGKAERTKTDMKRELRKKKKRQHEIQKAKEKKEKLKTDTDIRKKRNKDTAKVVEKLTKSRNVLKMNEQDNKATKSSTAFFNQLQDEVQSQIKANSSKTSVKKGKARFSAIKLKL